MSSAAINVRTLDWYYPCTFVQFNDYSKQDKDWLYVDWADMEPFLKLLFMLTVSSNLTIREIKLLPSNYWLVKFVGFDWFAQWPNGSECIPADIKHGTQIVDQDKLFMIAILLNNVMQTRKQIMEKYQCT